MIVVDTSAWVEFLRGTGSAVDAHLRALLRADAPVAMTELVAAELIAGASDAELPTVRRFVDLLPVLPLNGLEDFETAAQLYRTCRRAGEAIRQLADCLIAVPAIKADATLLHADRDFETLARHTTLRLEPV
ncbi:MAG TPA: PIN domain nuclease [Gaiellaceae bacterium]|nr:PIN domain nuclease [Gaiellaceae bacterium]